MTKNESNRESTVRGIHPRLFLFDVSGVLLQLSGGPTTLLSESPDPWLSWSHSDAVRQFESGESEVDQFVLSLIEEQNLAQSPEELYFEFASWPSGVDARASRLIQRLRDLGFLVATLSNSNPIHWNEFRAHFDADIDELMSENFVSYQTGVLKPDSAAFDAVFKRFDLSPEEVVFFDDSPVNVASANDRGVKAFLVKGIDDVLNVLHHLGVVSVDEFKCA